MATPYGGGGGQRRGGGSWNNKGRKGSWAVAEGRKQRRKEKRKGGNFDAAGRSTVGHFTTAELRVLMNSGREELMIRLEKDLKRFQKSMERCGDEQMKESEKMDLIKIVINMMFMVSQASDDYKSSANTIIAEFLSPRCQNFHFALNVYVQSVDVSQPLESTILQLCKLSKIAVDSFRDQSRALPISQLVELVDKLPANLAEQMQLVKQQQNEYFKLQKQIAAKSSGNKVHSKYSHDPSVFENWDDSRFRTMSILPTVDEVIGAPPPLRPNLINASYTGWEHYYDVQFRLLREDFVAPLRRGILQYRNPTNPGQRLTEVYIYENVEILEPQCTQEGLCYNIKVDVHKLNLRRSLEYTKRLMFGSLLCFTLDKFREVIYFAVITNRDFRDLRKGIVQVRFENPLEILQHVKSSRFIVAESRAFFEASRHVLRSLQTAEVATMPFKEHLILNDRSCIKPPKYLGSNSCYNLRAVYKASYVNRGLVCIANDSSWPTCNDPDIELDQSQLDAIKMALTQEIAIIQGPPGTGKTYIGYKIVQALLENREAWDPLRMSPILVMCFTNHALDQFLEGIIHHKVQGPNDLQERSPKIVRIGGRSQSEEIQKLSLKDVRHHLVPRNRYREVRNQRDYCLRFGSHIVWKTATLKNIVQNPVNVLLSADPLLTLKKFMHSSHFYQITQLPEHDDEMKHALEIWLGLRELELVSTSDDNEPYLRSDVEMQRPADSEEDSMEEDDELMAIKGEAELEEEIRKLETDDYKPLEAKRKEKQKNDRLTKYIKSKNENFTPVFRQNKKEKRLVWKRISYQECEKIYHRIRQAKPVSETSDEDFEMNITDNSFPMIERYRLLRLWISRYEKNLKASSQRDIVIFDRMCRDCKIADQRLDQIALERAEVIGMTTTGAAKYQHIIHLVKPKIVIVEEAAELLESHIVSALNGGTQHLILIGDHKQLRPKPNEYDLAVQHKLDISLFERLVRNGLPHATLQIQHRMRPEIAELVCPHIYDKLINHESVTKYKNVKGFRKNMYFFDHDSKEEHNQQLISHANEYEANFIVSLCKHLLKLGYEPSSITVLTAYSGQLLKLMNKMPKKDFEGVKITNVDNFQGEENDIIILSLVRSNDSGIVGFLKEENRICVALSRAREGLFCFGNFNKLLRVRVEKWDQIMTQVEEKGCLGSAFPLQCPNHKDFTFEVCKPEDFARLAPEGGCGKPCQYRLECGHVCPRLCHNDDLEHQKIKCKQRCLSECENNHQCSGYCYEIPCPPCSTKVVRNFPECGHTAVTMRCSDPVLCTEQCQKVLCENGHQCPRFCHEECDDDCQYNMEKLMPQCGHLQEMMCYQKPVDVYCHQKCKKIICEAGHQCPNECWQECVTECNKLVKKKIKTCGHEVKVPCSTDVSTGFACPKNCTKEYSCKHMCPKTCGEKCDPVCGKMVSKQLPKCGHKQLVPCFLPPEKAMCKMPCQKDLKCGHRCKNKCGETCQSVCKEPKELELPCGHNYMVECDQFNLKKLRLKYLGKVDDIKCLEPCKKEIKCGHKCRNKCSEPCSLAADCEELTVKTCLKGDHRIRAICGVPVTTCGRNCRKDLPCGHRCPNKCSEPCAEVCTEIVEYECQCGHTHESQCGEKPSCDCNKRCGTILSCGHRCTGKCKDCFESRIHPPCPFEVYVKRFCGHFVNVPCFGLEDKCNKKCQVAACSHSATPCDHECYKPCRIECKEPCIDLCPHKKCTKLCSQDCDDLRVCDKRCDKLLACGHPCLGVCGEKCLTVCLFCDEEKFRSAVQRLDGKQSLKELQYIELPCGHLFTVTFLDRHYHSQTGQENRLLSPLLCPYCKKVAYIHRYSSIIKERQQKIKRVKETIQSVTSPDLPQKCNQKFRELKEVIVNNRILSISDIRHLEGESYCAAGSQQSLFILEMIVEIGKICVALKNEKLVLERSPEKLLENIVRLSEEVSGEVSVQLIADIKSEVYRISLLYMVEMLRKAKAQRTGLGGPSDFKEWQKAIDKKLTINRKTYTSWTEKLKLMYSEQRSILSKPLIEPVNPTRGITALKGQWYVCGSDGHCYFCSAKYPPQKGIPPCSECD